MKNARSSPSLTAWSPHQNLWKEGNSHFPTTTELIFSLLHIKIIKMTKIEHSIRHNLLFRLKTVNTISNLYPSTHRNGAVKITNIRIPTTFHFLRFEHRNERWVDSFRYFKNYESESSEIRIVPSFWGKRRGGIAASSGNAGFGARRDTREDPRPWRMEEKNRYIGFL